MPTVSGLGIAWVMVLPFLSKVAGKKDNRIHPVQCRQTAEDESDHAKQGNEKVHC